MRTYRIGLQWVFLLLALALCSCKGLHENSALDRLKPCRAADGPTDAYCGWLEVWENRQTHAGRKIALKIVVLPALKQDYARDPLFILAGGPGQGAAELAGQLQEAFQPIQTARDIVLVDQRGTGKSNPLNCKPAKEAEDEDETPATFDARMHACLESYKTKADVTKYTTDIAMDDLDEVRQYLGYSTINLYGGSYGTRAGIVYARRHRDHTRAVILDGVAPTDMRLPLYMARDSQRALDRLISDCEKDAACGKRFPSLRQRLRTLLDKLQAHPQHVRYVHPRTGLAKDLDVKRLTVTSILFASLYSPDTAAMIPLLIEEAEKGDFTGFLALQGAADNSISGNMALGMQFSVLCSEDAPRIGPGSVERETADTFLGPEMAGLRLKPCDYWPRGQVDASYYTNSPSDVPALVLSGEFDPVTPPNWGQEVSAQWKNSRHLVVPATGHGTAMSGCVMKLISEFINAGSAANIDASCVQRLKRPPFFLGPSGPDPMGGPAQ